MDTLSLPDWFTSKDMLVIDLERTGMGPYDEITEVGMAHIRDGEFNTSSVYQQLFRPKRARMQPGARRITGITDRMLEAAPPLAQYLGDIRERIGDHVVVGHNIEVDMGFLNLAFAEERLPIADNKLIDTVALMHHVMGSRMRGLANIAERMGIPKPEHEALEGLHEHRALYDVYLTAEILRRIVYMAQDTLSTWERFRQSARPYEFPIRKADPGQELEFARYLERLPSA